LYEKLSGMTGTADTEAFEFRQIYGLDVVVIPTNQAMIRQDENDLVYLTTEEKYDSILEDIKECIERKRPVLVGTASIETSEVISRLLVKNNISHQVLNAKFHAKEADIISQAGRPSAVTIATNMAGRGTDIVLGGNWQAEIKALENPAQEQIDIIKSNWQKLHDEVIASGGLHIIGTERHESRRIDNQLRGRAGRQGDPGSSRFYLSMDDQLLRLFAGDRVKNMMKSLGMQKGEAIEARMVTNSIEKAQRKVEGRNFDIRKELLEYDDVANDQRSVIYQQRDELMLESNISEMVSAIRHEIVNKAIDGFIPPQSLEEQWDVAGLEQYLPVEFNCTLPIRKWLDEDSTLHEEPLRERILQAVDETYDTKKQAAQSLGVDMQEIEKRFMLHILDEQWKNHLSVMDHLRQGIHLRGYAQKNPKQEYKREAFELFQTMLETIKRELIKVLTHVEIRSQSELDEMERQKQEELDRQVLQQQKQADQFALFKEQRQAVQSDHLPYRRDTEKVGRNDPCPCGSGKKFKQCHGALTE
jgi:preprotein translocase subunit SecA